MINLVGNLIKCFALDLAAMFNFWEDWAKVRRRLRARDFYKRHANRINEKRRTSGYVSPNKKQSAKAWLINHPGYYRKYKLKRKYNITVDDWERIFDSQGRRCAICHRTDPVRMWHTDHDHTTGFVRGILCQPCNHLLGRLGDVIPLIRKRVDGLLAYLERDSKSTTDV
jgi:hypothetical protein